MKEFIDKLIERLEESKERYEDVAFFEMNTNGHTLDFEYSHGKENGVSEAIEIVNELAEEYKGEYIVNLCNQFCDKADEILQKSEEDVCKCERNYLFIADKYKVETGCGYTFYDLHHAEPFKFCPYCGKKIKVAPYTEEESELYRAKSVDGEYQEYKGDWK